MPKEALFRLIKRWRRYQPSENWNDVPRRTRGLYVLYRRRKGDSDTHKVYEVTYIGVAGLGKGGTGGIRGRLQRHFQKKKRMEKQSNGKPQGWTHYSMFEVHDNVTREEIRELETLLLAIFKHDLRVGLTNKQKGSHKLTVLRSEHQWR